MEKLNLRVTLEPHVQPVLNRSIVQRSRIMVVAGVVLFHVLALWALQTGLLQRVMVAVQEQVVPVSVISEAPSPSRHEIVQSTPSEKHPAPVQPLPVPSAVTPTPSPQAPAPAPLAVTETAKAQPAPEAPTGVAVAPAVVATQAPTQAATHAAPKVEQPSSTADYLHNPKPRYPRLSQSRNEQGTVILNVLVGVDGKVREVAVKSSSGFELLDRTAREAVSGWTFVPGKRNGVAVEMSVDVPIPFRLTD